MKKVIELLRVSTDQQAGQDRYGLPAQRAANRRTCETYGLEIAETIELIDVSGAEILYEPAMLRLLREIARPEIAGVVTREFSRLMRPDNYADWKILERFAQTNTLLYLPEGSLNFADKHGRILGTLQGLFAGLERETIRERMMSGKEELRRRGGWATGAHTLPYAVTYSHEQGFAYQPEAAARVRQTYHRFLAGETSYTTLAQLAAVDRGTIKNWLRNPIYKGWLVYDKKRDPSPAGKYGLDPATGEARISRETGKLIRDRRRVARAPQDVIRVKVLEPPLVPEADWDRVQAMIARKAANSLRQRRFCGQFTYAGYLWCAACNERIYTFRNRTKFFYFCSAKRSGGCPDTAYYMGRERLEALLDKAVKRVLGSERQLRRILRAQREGEAERSRAAEAAQAARLVASLKAKRERYIEMYADGTIDRVARDTKLKAADAALKQAEETAARLAPSLPQWDPRQVAQRFAAFKAWDHLTREEKRKLLAVLAPRFLVARYPSSGYCLKGVTLFEAQPPGSSAKDSRWLTAP